MCRSPGKRLCSHLCSVIFAILSFFAANKTSALTERLARYLDDPAGYPIANGDDAIALMWSAIVMAADFLLPFVVVLTLSGLVASLSRTRRASFWIASSRNGTGVGHQRLEAHLRDAGHVEFGKSLFKFTVISAVVLALLMSERVNVVNALFTDPLTMPAVMLSLATRLISAVCVATIVLVAADLLWSRFHWRSELRMTKQEVKEEFKQAEGDPMVKARMRALAQERSGSG